ncbi:MAG: ABC transporter substrate-binding protein [Chloroflexota bacterium]
MPSFMSPGTHGGARWSRRQLLGHLPALSSLAALGLLSACGGGATVAQSASATLGSAAATQTSTVAAGSTTAAGSSTVTATAATTLTTSAPAAATTTESSAISTSASTAATAVRKGATAIQYWTWDQIALQTENKSFLPQFRQQHPDIEVQATYVAWNTNGYFDKLQTMGASADAPDVFWQSVAYTWDFANNGLALDLQPLINRSLKLEDYFQPVLSILRFPNPSSGDMYAFPSRWVASLLYYNKDLLQKVGVAPPDETWDYQKMIDAATKLTVHGADPTSSHFGMSARVDNSILDSWIKAYGGQVLNDDFSKCMLDQPNATSTVQLVADQCVKNAIAPKPGEKLGTVAPTFQDGTIAMTIDGSYTIDTYRQKAKFDWDVTLVPKGPVSRSVYGGPDSVAISKGSRNPDAAWTFVQAYCGPGRPVESYAGGSVPVYKPTAQQPAWLEQGKAPAHKQVLLDSAQYLQGADFSSHWSEWRAALSAELNPALTGQKTAQDACRSATDRINAILAQVKINKQVHPNL